VPSDVNAN
jgi:uncharacterized protein YukE